MDEACFVTWLMKFNGSGIGIVGWAGRDSSNVDPASSIWKNKYTEHVHHLQNIIKHDYSKLSQYLMYNYMVK